MAFRRTWSSCGPPYPFGRWPSARLVRAVYCSIPPGQCGLFVVYSVQSNHPSGWCGLVTGLVNAVYSSAWSERFGHRLVRAHNGSIAPVVHICCARVCRKTRSVNVLRRTFKPAPPNAATCVDSSGRQYVYSGFSFATVPSAYLSHLPKAFAPVKTASALRGHKLRELKVIPNEEQNVRKRDQIRDIFANHGTRQDPVLTSNGFKRFRKN